MLDKIQPFFANLNTNSRKADKKAVIPDYPADEFVKSNKSVSFKGGNFAFDVVSKNFFRGSKPGFSDLQTLKEFGIKVVIDLIGDGRNIEEKGLIEKLGMKYVSIPIDSSAPPSEKQVDDFLKIVKNEENLPVFVHCREGKDRTGIMTAIYAIEVLGQSFEKAYSDVLKYGHDFYGSFKQDKFLESYYSNNQKIHTQEQENLFYTREIVNRVRKRYFRQLKELYHGNLSEADLDTRYA